MVVFIFSSMTAGWLCTSDVSSTYSPSVLLPALEMSHTSAFALACQPSLEIICSGMHVLHILVAVTILGWHLFRSELLIVRLHFEGGVYTKTNKGQGMSTPEAVPVQV